MVVQPSIEEHEALLKRVKALEEENKRLRNEKKETSRSPLEVELQPKTRDRKASRNSWIDIYNENTTLHKTKKLFGQKVEADDSLEWRVKWGQRGVGVSSLVGLICFLAGQHIALNVFSALGLIFYCMIYCKNFSFVIAKRLLRETRVVIIIILSLCNLVIDVARPSRSLSPILGLMYMLLVSVFLFLDAVKVKSRVFVMVVGIIFVLANISSIYSLIFGDSSQGVILLKYTVQGNEYTFMKRSTKRSIFVQVMLFSLNGIYILLKDKNQELMIFAKGNVYRETGTTSKEVKDKQYSDKIEFENVV